LNNPADIQEKQYGRKEFKRLCDQWECEAEADESRRLRQISPGIMSRTVNKINGLTVHFLEAGFEMPNQPAVLLLQGPVLLLAKPLALKPR
jgi:hypothetical protein